MSWIQHIVAWLLWLQSLLVGITPHQEAPPIVPTVSSTATQSPPAPTTGPLASGIAKYYSPGVMEQVARNRGLTPQRYMASVPYCERIGERVWATVNGHMAQYLIVDCSGPADRARHLREGLVIEISWPAYQDFFPEGEDCCTAAEVWEYVHK